MTENYAWPRADIIACGFIRLQWDPKADVQGPRACAHKSRRRRHVSHSFENSWHRTSLEKDLTSNVYIIIESTAKVLYQILKLQTHESLCGHDGV